MSEFKIYDITVNYLSEPCGIDSQPKLSYKLSSDTRGDRQASYRIRVYSSEELQRSETADIWDSGEIKSEQVLHIPVNDEKMLPVRRYHITVEAWNSVGLRAEGRTSFVTGKRGERWDARWITGGFVRKDDAALGAPYLRHGFNVSKPVKDAFLSVCGLGYHECRINGKKPGDDWLSPAFTRYDKTTLYMAYDVKSLVREGENAIGVILGNGWYNCFAEDPWNTRAASWRSYPRLLCELKLIYCDGTSEKVVSSPDWKASEGPIIFNGIRNGEHYDARRELGDWSEAGYDDSEWKGTRIVRAPGGELRAMEMEPIRVYRTFVPKRKWKTANGWAFDVGQNQAGICRYRLRGKEGTEFTFRYTDVLTDDGELNMGAIGGFIRSHGFQTDKYIKKSDEEETWNPLFVYHGFQYVELSGMDYEPECEDITVMTLCSGVREAGRFSCSDELLNKLQQLCRWSTVSNLHSIPTDCPHREKNGWTGDTSISSEQMMTNFGMGAFFTKWSADIRDSQRPAGQIPSVVPSTGWGYNGLNGPDWSSALVNIPYNLYLYNDDTDILRDNYEAIKRNCDFMESMMNGYIVHYGLGDWCAPFEGPAISVNMGSFKCPTAVTDTAFFHNAAKLVEKMAKVFGYAGDAEYYGALAAKIREAFRNKFFDKETYTVAGDCQTSTGAMLYFGLYEPDEYKPLVKKLVSQIEKNDWHLDFGILGCKFVMHSLGRAGEGNVGHRMIAQRTFPGCKRWIDLGATTLWECWNGGGSHNHHMFSDLSSFMYKYVGGIEPDENAPGFRHTIMRPAVNCGMESASAEHESMFGKVKCYWATRDGRTTLDISVPFGCTATLCLPDFYENELYEGSAPAKDALGHRTEDGFFKLSLIGGEYSFETR